MDNPPNAHRCVQAGKMPAFPGGAAPVEEAVLGARATRPHPAGGRQWTTRRRPTVVQAGGTPAPRSAWRSPAMARSVSVHARVAHQFSGYFP